MSTLVSVVQSAKPKPVTTTKPVPTKAAREVQTNETQILTPILGSASVGLALVVVALIVYGKIQIKKLEKKIKFEQFRTRELDKKFKLALETIRKMETNPDLINSREFNLDYLRMRMSEEVFHFAIVNQIKIQIKEKISQALRPGQADRGVVGIASTNGRQVDEMFDVEYETGNAPNVVKRVLFRIQIRLMKLPTQPTSATISQIIDCVENFLSPVDDNDTWQPTIQGRIAYMHWDQKAKPTPLLVLEQSNEGVNVSFRTSRQPNANTPAQQPGQPEPSQQKPPSSSGKKKSANSQKV
ncbi:hypothetical protein [Scytonema sp. NUACC26]|uniref:hypothetical protein n=1 Tax=Scytonema sp. NUACC26 TaxID=3140176 RepID=UPI0034DC0F66